MPTVDPRSEENILGAPVGWRSGATVVNERPVDVQSRSVTEPQRDAGGEAD